MAVASPERVREDLTRLVHGVTGLRELTIGAKRVLGRALGFEGICMLTTDPATLLLTGEAGENGLPHEEFARMREIELSGRDVNTFEALLQAPRPAARLSAATGGDLVRSERHRDVRHGHGMGD